MRKRRRPARSRCMPGWTSPAPGAGSPGAFLQEAETEYGGEVTLEYHSFELADLPADYLSNSEADFLQFLYAGTTREEAEQMMWVVRFTGARLGLSYDFDGVQHTSTFLAHQLLHHAKANGRQLPMLDVLFSASFQRGRDLRRDRRARRAGC